MFGLSSTSTPGDAGAGHGANPAGTCSRLLPFLAYDLKHTGAIPRLLTFLALLAVSLPPAARSQQIAPYQIRPRIERPVPGTTASGDLIAWHAGAF